MKKLSIKQPSVQHLNSSTVQQLKKMITDINQLDTNKLYTYADYLTWRFQERVELIKGKLFKMSPAPSSKHQSLSFELSLVLGNYLKGKNCKAFTAPFDVKLFSNVENKESVIQPDLCIICDLDKIDSRGCNGAPDLIIEILSPSTAAKDLREKKKLYEENGVFEYWAVEPHDQLVFQYELIENKYQQEIVAGNEVLKSKIFEGLDIDLKGLFEVC